MFAAGFVVGVDVAVLDAFGIVRCYWIGDTRNTKFNT